MHSGVVRALSRLSAIQVLALVVACGGDPAGPVDPEDVMFDASLGVDLDQMTRTASGLYYQVRSAGIGEEVAEAGDTAFTYYTGWLHTGFQFDSVTSGDPFEVSPLGSANVIEGWNEGLQGMRLNETRLLVIPSDLAWGSQGAGGGVIPRFATVVFEVTLVALEKAGA